MRIGEVLGAEVVAEDGRRLGEVHDVRLRRTPKDEIVIDGLVIGAGALAVRLDYTSGDVGGPWLLAWLMRRLGRRALYRRGTGSNGRHRTVCALTGSTGDLPASHRGG